MLSKLIFFLSFITNPFIYVHFAFRPTLHSSLFLVSLLYCRWCLDLLSLCSPRYLSSQYFSLLFLAPPLVCSFILSTPNHIFLIRKFLCLSERWLLLNSILRVTFVGLPLCSNYILVLSFVQLVKQILPPMSVASNGFLILSLSFITLLSSEFKMVFIQSKYLH